MDGSGTNYLSYIPTEQSTAPANSGSNLSSMISALQSGSMKPGGQQQNPWQKLSQGFGNQAGDNSMQGGLSSLWTGTGNSFVNGSPQLGQPDYNDVQQEILNG